MHTFGRTFSKFHNTFERSFFNPKDRTTNFYGQNPVCICTCEHVQSKLFITSLL